MVAVLIICKKHNKELAGQPGIHSITDNKLKLWVADFEDMWCEVNKEDPYECKETWTISYASLGPEYFE